MLADFLRDGVLFPAPARLLAALGARHHIETAQKSTLDMSA